MCNWCVSTLGDDEGEARPAPSLSARFEIRDRREDGEGEKLYAVTVGCGGMRQHFDGEMGRFLSKVCDQKCISRTQRWDKDDVISASDLDEEARKALTLI